MTVTDSWSPAAAPAVRREYPEDLFEPASCRSLLWLPLDTERPSASLRCTLDAAHRHDASDARHGYGEATRWTDEQAAEALADFGPRPAAGLQCTECPRPAFLGGLCQMCRAAELAAGDRETESEDAA